MEVTTPDQIVLVTLTRTHFNSLGIEPGTTVWVRPTPGAPTVPTGASRHEALATL